MPIDKAMMLISARPPGAKAKNSTVLGTPDIYPKTYAKIAARKTIKIPRKMANRNGNQSIRIDVPENLAPIADPRTT